MRALLTLCFLLSRIWSAIPNICVGAEVLAGYEYFRGIPNGSWSGNTGLFGGFNVALSSPCHAEGCGLQLAGSYGIYNWYGSGSGISNSSTSPEGEGFFTVGLYRHTPSSGGFNVGIDYDWMVNQNFGAFGLDPNLSQLRARVGYLIKTRNEVGLWGTIYLTSARHCCVNRRICC